MASTSGRPSADVTLDHVVAFLQKREGIDKTLKIIRYTSRLIAATSTPGSPNHARFSALEKSVGVSRSGLWKLSPSAVNATAARELPRTATDAADVVQAWLTHLFWLLHAGKHIA
jgi:hypothetical protein